MSTAQQPIPTLYKAHCSDAERKASWEALSDDQRDDTVAALAAALAGAAAPPAGPVLPDAKAIEAHLNKADVKIVLEEHPTLHKRVKMLLGLAKTGHPEAGVKLLNELGVTDTTDESGRVPYCVALHAWLGTSLDPCAAARDGSAPCLCPGW
jgi:hypothetical protein